MSREREYDQRELPTERQRPRFDLAQVVATPGALRSVHPDELQRALLRHVRGDWGDLDAEDREANERAVLEGSRLLSAYRTASGEKFWIITECDRSVTTFLLPSEY